MASTTDVNHMTSLGLESNFTTATADGLFYYHRGLQNLRTSSPILVLVHGYPQSNFMWRHLIPLLPSDIPFFVPDIPGYGRSSPLPGSHDKLSTGTAILNTLASLVPPNSKPTPIIIAGHDRGARICHRLAVSSPHPNLSIRGTILLDIVPTLSQWHSFSNPTISTGNFHWPLLANPLAPSMVKALGGDVWARSRIEAWMGKSEAGQARVREHGAMDVYEELFRKESVVDASCDDYRAGAEEDVRMQDEDQREGRKIDCDALVVYSEGYLGSRFDVEGVWEEWIGKGRLDARGIGGGCGHFMAEEAPKEAAAAILEFYKRVCLVG